MGSLALARFVCGAPFFPFSYFFIGFWLSLRIPFFFEFFGCRWIMIHIRHCIAVILSIGFVTLTSFTLNSFTVLWMSTGFARGVALLWLSVMGFGGSLVAFVGSAFLAIVRRRLSVTCAVREYSVKLLDGSWYVSLEVVCVWRRVHVVFFVSSSTIVQYYAVIYRLSVCLPVFPFCLFVYLFVLFVCLFVCLSVLLSVHPSVCPSTCVHFRSYFGSARKV